MIGMKRWGRWMVAILAVSIAFGIGHRGGRLASPPVHLDQPAAARAVPPSPQEERASTPGAAAASSALPLPAMPAAGTLFADAWPALLARAEAGDGVAACRLAVAGFRCLDNDWQRVHPSTASPSAIAAMAPDVQALGIEIAARQLERRRQDAAFCEGVDDALLQSMPTMLLRAARGSDEPHALALFAEGIAAGRHVLFDDEGRRLYREHGGWAIERLIARGHAHGLHLLAVGSSGAGAGHLRVLVPEDETLMYAARELLREASGATGPSPTWSRLDPDMQARVDARMASLRQRFGSEALAPPQGGQADSVMLAFGVLAMAPEEIGPYCEGASPGAAR